jgi:hypothetical protein
MFGHVRRGTATSLPSRFPGAATDFQWFCACFVPSRTDEIGRPSCPGVHEITRPVTGTDTGRRSARAHPSGLGTSRARARRSRRRRGVAGLREPHRPGGNIQGGGRARQRPGFARLRGLRVPCSGSSTLLRGAVAQPRGRTPACTAGRGETKAFGEWPPGSGGTSHVVAGGTTPAGTGMLSRSIP